MFKHEGFGGGMVSAERYRGGLSTERDGGATKQDRDATGQVRETGTRPDTRDWDATEQVREPGTPPNRSESPGRHRTGPRDQDATDRVRPFTLNAWIAGGGRLPAGGGHFLAGSVGSVAKAYLAGSAHGAVKA